MNYNSNNQEESRLPHIYLGNIQSSSIRVNKYNNDYRITMNKDFMRKGKEAFQKSI